MQFHYNGNGKQEQNLMAVDRLFPGFDRKTFEKEFALATAVRETLRSEHEIILHTMRELAEGGYARMLELFGFHDQYTVFGGHCHQMTPALGALLLLRGIPTHYLECARVDPGDKTKKIDPRTEEDPGKREEFCRIDRIPYCALEIETRCLDTYYLSPKHVRFDEKGTATPLLDAGCYKKFQYAFVEETRKAKSILPHVDDSDHSGLYLAHYPFPGEEKRPQNDFAWRKRARGAQPEDPFEVFFAFCRMEIIL